MNEGIIFAKMVAIMREIEPIAKDRVNTGQKYKFRGIDDVYNALHSIMAKHGVFMVPRVLSETHEERLSKNGSLQIYRIYKVEYHFVAEDGSAVVAVVVGEGMDSGDKAGNKALSAAQKYAVLQVFLVPTQDDKDSENDSHELTSLDAPAPTLDLTAPFSPHDQIAVDRIQMLLLNTHGINIGQDHDDFKRLIQELDGTPLKDIKTKVKEILANAAI